MHVCHTWLPGMYASEGAVLVLSVMVCGDGLRRVVIPALCSHGFSYHNMTSPGPQALYLSATKIMGPNKPLVATARPQFSQHNNLFIYFLYSSSQTAKTNDLKNKKTKMFLKTWRKWQNIEIRRGDCIYVVFSYVLSSYIPFSQSRSVLSVLVICVGRLFHSSSNFLTWS